MDSPPDIPLVERKKNVAINTPEYLWVMTYQGPLGPYFSSQSSRR